MKRSVVMGLVLFLGVFIAFSQSSKRTVNSEIGFQSINSLQRWGTSIEGIYYEISYDPTPSVPLVMSVSAKQGSNYLTITSYSLNLFRAVSTGDIFLDGYIITPTKGTVYFNMVQIN